MKNQALIISTVKNVFAFFIALLIPIFFLPFTQEFYITGKIYFLAISCLVLFILSVVELLVTKKIIWQKKIFDNVFFLFFITTGLSILLTSTNKVQALFNPNFGLVFLLGLFILYFYLSRSIEIDKKINIIFTINLSALILAVITIITFFQPFKDVSLPPIWQFLKNPSFTPVGIQLDLAIILGFFAVFSLSQIMTQKQKSDNQKSILFNLLSLIFNLLALSLTLYSIFKPADASQTLTLPPFRLSWYAAVEVLKNPLTALFGVGVDNFAAIFAKVKDFTYDQSTLWQIQSFNISRSAILHIFAETGLLGIIAFGLLIFSLIKHVRSQNKYLLLPVVYLLTIFIFFPPSFISFFLLAIMLAYVASIKLPVSTVSPSISTFDITNLIPLYLGLPIVSFLIVGVAGFFLIQNYRSEYFFKQALNGYLNNNLQQLYDNQRQAILIDPYIERYRISFSQTNLLIATNIVNRAVQAAQAKTGGNNKIELSAQDQQVISQAIQAAISEAKAAAALNPQKAGNWENLAIIYRNIINFVQGQADAWTVSSYQQAIGLDPQNANYRLNLGGVYYSLGVYDEAVKLFEQATTLKPDWPNGYYNLAWALFQKADYQNAALNMQNVVYLLNPKKDAADYDKASKDLEEFKKKLPGATETPTPTPNQKQPEQLTLPTPPAGKVEPPIKLPKEASPEAR